jgi:hypothetical protein
VSNSPSFFESPEALELVGELANKLDSANQLTLISHYRKLGVDPELLTFALNQARFRQRAKLKFSERANQMLFTEPGLEQATRSEVAHWHADKFLAAGLSSITDLGAGIGSDSIAFAVAGLKVDAIENHLESFQALRHNLAPFERATATNSDARDHEITTQALWLDPARREQDRKSLSVQRLDPSMFSPSLDFVFDMARKFPTGIKLAPGFPHELIPSDFEANWVSQSGDLVELTLWSEPLGTPGLKKAVMVADGILEFEGTDRPGFIAPLADYIHEPDVSLIRSHLLGDFANQNQLTLISENIAYMTSGQPIESPWLKSYKVQDVLPLDVKQIKAYCTKNQIGVLEIKKRGVDITPEALRPKLKLKGAGAATLILTKVGDARQAIVCEPIR